MCEILPGNGRAIIVPIGLSLFSACKYTLVATYILYVNTNGDVTFPGNLIAIF